MNMPKNGIYLYGRNDIISAKWIAKVDVVHNHFYDIFYTNITDDTVWIRCLESGTLTALTCLEHLEVRKYWENEQEMLEELFVELL